MDYKVLKEIRLLRKITLKELSKTTGINRNILSNIENGKCNPTVNRLEVILNALNCKYNIGI